MKINKRLLQIINDKISNILTSINGRKLYLYGYGNRGKIIAKALEDRLIKIDGVCDRSFKKGETIVDKYNVVGIDELDPFDCYVIVSIATLDISIIHNLSIKGFIAEKDWCHIFDSINRKDIVYKGIPIGKYTYGYENFLSICPLAKSIGRYCSISATAKIWNNHPMECITTSPILDVLSFFYPMYKSYKPTVEKYGLYVENTAYEASPLRNNELVIIGNDVWIGANVCVLPGVKIGDGAILAAGAIVNKDVEPYEIVGGVPAKHIKYRFSKDEINILLRVKWWDWTSEEFNENINLLANPKLFFEKYKEL